MKEMPAAMTRDTGERREREVSGSEEMEKVVVNGKMQ
jgi:hypothetical protein